MFLEHEQITPPTTPEAWSLAFADSSSSSGVRKAPQPRTVFPPTPDFSPKTENHDLSQLSADIPELFLPAVRPHDDVSLPSRPKVGKLRIVIVTENFLPKVDGVTRTLARLLEHLEKEGHEAILLGPKTGMTHYASHPTVGTMGIPLLNYPGLKLNFLRPKFWSKIKEFKPDVIHFVDPIWLCPQMMLAIHLGLGGRRWAGLSGAIVASYHTNLATYATLFGMPRLSPILWQWQHYLYSKSVASLVVDFPVDTQARTLITLCPSQSTLSTLESHNFPPVRIWPRGVELEQFSPSKRSNLLRQAWSKGCGVTIFSEELPSESGFVRQIEEGEERIMILFVGRISWEKNLYLLLASFSHLLAQLPAGKPKPILLFVGDGPARKEIENICSERGFDAVFMGMRIGAELGRCYASADIFAFPSFTETFGQVVLEAMASGLPVVGLDADGTRDLVTHSQTGLLMPFPPHADGQTWSTVCRSTTLPPFAHCRKDYAELLLQLVVHGKQRQSMSNRASTDGVEGFTWWDAMERCVDGYREAISIDQKNHNGTSAYPRWDITSTPTPILGLAVLGLASGFYLLGTLAK